MRSAPAAGSGRSIKTAADIAVTSLTGVGPAVAARLERLGIGSLQDLVLHLPLRYEDRTRVVPIDELRPGERVLIEGRVVSARCVFRGRRSLMCRLADEGGEIGLRFFHFSRSQQARLTVARRLQCFGEVREGSDGLEMVHPEYRAPPPPAERPAQLTAIYPTTEGIGQIRIRGLIRAALAHPSLASLPDLVPASLLACAELPNLADALRFVHGPPPAADLTALAAGRHPAQQRLAVEELLAYQLSLRLLRARARQAPSHELPHGGPLVGRFLASLPFALTAAQQRVLQEILDDLAGASPMMRLVQGDVGSGKTVVAAAAALRAIERGHQVAVMAPTELLAEQHRRNFIAWFEALDLEVGWLSGSLGAAARRAALAAARSGRTAATVGTHALFQEGVEFNRLALVIVDEQHRFGVDQRLALHDKGLAGGASPHQLIMTATPIPRTLAMTVYADLDTSLIDELPPGRQPVDTVVMPEAKRDEVLRRVRDACAGGRQAYWVCPLIEASEQLRGQAAEQTAARLQEALPQLGVGLIHGRMKTQAKDRVMRRFLQRELMVLVATTVIEVGVDVPNASLMIIENAERMGLAQLHQLRGRVGRGSERSSCVLMYRPPLTKVARSRLETLRCTGDGFEVARRDLELRGPGEMLGTRQTGVFDLRVADLLQHAEFLPIVQDAAEDMLRQRAPEVRALLRRWVGGDSRYGQV